MRKKKLCMCAIIGLPTLLSRSLFLFLPPLPCTIFRLVCVSRNILISVLKSCLLSSLVNLEVKKHEYGTVEADLWG